MILEDAQQAVTATQRMLDAVRAGVVTTTELRAALEQTRVLLAAGAAFQTAAAELIAARERHGDGGAEVLAVSAGLTQSEAHSQVKTAQALRKVPELRDAVQAGQVPQANARRLADVITKTGADAVAGDTELLKQAASLRPEQFGVATRRWVTAQQGDNGALEHARQRAKRYLKFYDTEDGMIALRGEFDKITGTRIHNRIRHIAGKLFTNDKKLPKDSRREFPQCMADALDHATTNTGSETSSSRNRNDQGARNDYNSQAAGKSTATDAVTINRDSGTTDAAEIGAGGAGGGWVADITLVAHVDDATGELIAELSDGRRLPDAVLEELSCNTRWTGLIYDRVGDAIWRSRSRRTVTESQWQTLLTIYGGCFHCGAPPNICQAHHIIPYSRGGATSVKNMVMVCWNCHHNIHHNNWHIQTHDDDSHHTLHPPTKPSTQPQYGTAQAEDPPPERPARRGRSPAAVAENQATRTRPSARDPSQLW